MDPRNYITPRPKLGAYIFALLFVFTGVFSIKGDLMGKAAPSASNDLLPEAIEAADIEMGLEESAPALSKEAIEAALKAPRKVEPLPPTLIDTETLWLARCMYSETKRPEEQELVGWVVRNRVETAYRGKRSYQDVVLDSYQFSAFNPGSRKRTYYSQLTPYSKARGWQRTLAIAYAIRHADTTYRPFSTKTRHFYSEQSMKGQAHPEWADGLNPVTPARPIKLNARRFRFFSNVY